MRTLIFVFIFIVLIMGGLTVFVYTNTSQINEEVNVIAQQNLLRTLQQAQVEVFELGRGSSKTVSVNLPYTCFVDESTHDRYANPTLEAVRTPDNNVYFFPNGQGSLAIGLDKSPLCLEGMHDLVFTNAGKVVVSAEGEPPVCSSLLLQGDPKEKIDILFIPFSYGPNGDPTYDATKAIGVFERVEPFKSHFEKFNFYMHHEQASCSAGGHIACDNSELLRQAASCPHDYIFVMGDLSINLARSSAIPGIGIAKINLADEDLVIAHEFGHLFGNLYEEYTDDAYYASRYSTPESIPNCDVINCPSFDGGSCYKGCTTSSFYRATENSIMRDFREEDGHTFGPVNERILEEQLEVYP